VPAAVEQEIAVDLVGDDPDVAPRAGGGHALKLGALEDAPDGIVRVAEQERARARAERVREASRSTVYRPPAPGVSGCSSRVRPWLPAARRIGG